MPKLEMWKQNFLLQFSFFHSASIGFQNSSAKRRSLDKQKASQYAAMCYCVLPTALQQKTYIEWQEGCSSPLDLLTFHLGLKSIKCQCAARPLMRPTIDPTTRPPNSLTQKKKKKGEIPQCELRNTSRAFLQIANVWKRARRFKKERAQKIPKIPIDLSTTKY